MKKSNNYIQSKIRVSNKDPMPTPHVMSCQHMYTCTLVEIEKSGYQRVKECSLWIGQHLEKLMEIYVWWRAAHIDNKRM